MVLAVVMLPIATCVAADAEMTQAESECCQRMAEECGGGMDMPDSHSCCTKASVQKNDAVLGQAGHTFILEFTAALDAGLSTLPGVEERAVAIFSDVHGPPGISSKTLQALRI